MEAPPLADDIQIMLRAIEFEENRVATIKKWIKEDGMDKQEAKDRFQREMDALVRDALDLPKKLNKNENIVKGGYGSEEREAKLAALENDEEEWAR